MNYKNPTTGQIINEHDFEKLSKDRKNEFVYDDLNDVTHRLDSDTLTLIKLPKENNNFWY